MKTALCFEVSGEFWWGEQWIGNEPTGIAEAYRVPFEGLPNAPVTAYVFEGCTAEQAAALLRELAATLDEGLPNLPPLPSPADCGEEVPF